MEHSVAIFRIAIVTLIKLFYIVDWEISRRLNSAKTCARCISIASFEGLTILTKRQLKKRQCLLRHRFFFFFYVLCPTKDTNKLKKRLKTGTARGIPIWHQILSSFQRRIRRRRHTSECPLYLFIQISFCTNTVVLTFPYLLIVQEH